MLVAPQKSAFSSAMLTRGVRGPNASLILCSQQAAHFCLDSGECCCTLCQFAAYNGGDARARFERTFAASLGATEAAAELAKAAVALATIRRWLRRQARIRRFAFFFIIQLSEPIIFSDSHCNCIALLLNSS